MKNKRIVNQGSKIPGGGYFSLLKDKLGTINKTNFKVRLSVVISTILLGILLLAISSSYALWSVSNEKTGVLNIKAADFTYNLSSDSFMDDKTLMINAGDTKTFSIEVENINDRSTSYQLYYQAVRPSSIPQGLTVKYADNTPSSLVGSDFLASTKKIMYIVVDNPTTSSVTIRFDIKGGFAGKPVMLDSNMVSIKDSYNVYIVNHFYNTGGVQMFTPTISGYHRVQLYGASGATPYGGRGAYTTGIMYFNKGETFYINVGQAGHETTGGYNGGGNDLTNSTNSPKGTRGGGGGGATDIRLNGGAWNDITSLRSRIMVAAGGGGQGTYSPQKTNEGYAGGLEGASSSGTPSYCGATGGTQTWAGVYACDNSSRLTAGGFGYGGSLMGSNAVINNTGGGGGGGYYGGGGAFIGDVPGQQLSAGGGGSSYISGHPGCIGVTSANNTNPKVSSYSKIEDSYHYSGRIFKSTEMKNGSQSMPNYREVGNITGNSGDGYAKITSCYTKGEQC